MKNLIIIFILITVACSKSKIKIDPLTLAGKYYSNENVGDSIFVYVNGTYLYKHYSGDKIAVDSVFGVWEYRDSINTIFFKEFRFLSRYGKSDFSGTWPPEVIKTPEGKIALRYSEDVLYVKKDD